MPEQLFRHFCWLAAGMLMPEACYSIPGIEQYNRVRSEGRIIDREKWIPEITSIFFCKPLDKHQVIY
jgi:hypothetical protein